MIGDRDRAFDPKYKSEFAKKFKEKFNQWKKRGYWDERRNQQVFADLVGCNKNSISDYMNGKTVPEKRSLRKIAEVLGCDVSELLPFGHDELYKYSQDYINQYGDELSQYAQKVGLSLFLLRGLREVVSDFDGSFPVFLPFTLNPDPFCGKENSLVRMPPESPSDSAKMETKYQLFQIQRGEKRITMSYCDVNFLKALQDELVSVVERAFVERAKEMDEEMQRINEYFIKDHTNKEGWTGVPSEMEREECEKLFSLLKYSKKITEVS